MRQGLNQGLLPHPGRQDRQVADRGKEPVRLLAANAFDGFAGQLKSFFSGIPHQWHGRGDMARYEAWYTETLYACFRTIGLVLRVDASSRGRSDMVALHGGYGEKYRHRGSPSTWWHWCSAGRTATWTP